jgi:hypothetical protein
MFRCADWNGGQRSQIILGALDERETGARDFQSMARCNVRTTMVQTVKTFGIVCNDRVYGRIFQQAFQQKL